MKSRWMIILVLAALVVVSAVGAVAYFSSQRVTNGTIKSGTLDLRLSGNGADFDVTTALPWDVSNMAPGDEVSGKLYMKNIGTIGAKQVSFEWGNILNNPSTADLAQQIILTEIYDSTDSGNQIAAVTGVADTNADGKTSLYELAALSGRFGWPFDAVSGTVPPTVVPWLPAGGTQWLWMKMQFNPEAGNDFQGITMNYGLIVTAHQNQVFPNP